MTLLSPGDDDGDAQQRLDRMLAHFRGPRERCHAGTLDELEAVLRGFEAAGVSRVYLQHPDRRDYAAIGLWGELASRLKTPDRENEPDSRA